MQLFKKSIKQQFAIIGGNILEWYDYALYGYLATIIAKLFFPEHNYIDSLILTFGVFALCNFIKPFGGLMIGSLGDRYGCKYMLLLTMSGVTISTILMGIVPTEASIGISASILVFLLRLTQGFFISAEFTGSTSYEIATVNANQKGFFGSLPQVSMLLGGIIATAVFIMTNFFLGKQNFNAWAWRIPFLLSGIFAAYILYLRYHFMQEISYKAKDSSFIPIFKSLLLHKKILLLAILIECAATAGVGYFNYEINFMVSELHQPLVYASSLITSSCILTIVLMPLFGRLADKIGYNNLLTKTLICALLLAYPVFYLLTQNNLWLISIGAILFAIFIAAYLSVVAVYISELIPKSIRLSGFAFSHNATVALFHGLVPLVSFYLIKLTHNFMMSMCFFVVTCLISLLALWVSRHDKILNHQSLSI